MVPAQFIGFTSVAVLGRLGEFVRPYLVARRQQVTFTSQLAVYTVERVFDLLAAAGVDGIVVAATGNGSIHHRLAAALLRAGAGGAVVWRATRCLEGVIVETRADEFPTAGPLGPVKARVELLLELLRRRAGR